MQVVWGALNYFLHDCGVLGAYQLYLAVVRRAATDTNGGLSPGCNEEVFVEGQSGQQTSYSRPAPADQLQPDMKAMFDFDNVLQYLTEVPSQ